MGTKMSIPWPLSGIPRAIFEWSLWLLKQRLSQPRRAATLGHGHGAEAGVGKRYGQALQNRRDNVRGRVLRRVGLLYCGQLGVVERGGGTADAPPSVHIQDAAIREAAPADRLSASHARWANRSATPLSLSVIIRTLTSSYLSAHR